LTPKNQILPSKTPFFARFAALKMEFRKRLERLKKGDANIPTTGMCSS